MAQKPGKKYGNQPTRAQEPVAKVAQKIETTPIAWPPYFWLPSALALVLYANTLGHGFVLDDDLAIKLHSHVPKGVGGWFDILISDYRTGGLGEGMYRPVSLLQFAFEWMLAPESPGVHHFFNLFWFAILGATVYLLLRQWFDKAPWWVAMAGACLFVAHPIHTEVVANIKSRDEIMSLLGAAFGLYAWGKHLMTGQRNWFWISLGALFVGLMSKESAIVLVPMYALVAWHRGIKNIPELIKKSWPAFTVGILYLIIRFSVVGAGNGKSPDPNDNAIVLAEGLGQRYATGFGVLWQYLQLLIWPRNLSSDYSYHAIPIKQWGDPVVWMGLLSHIAMIAVAVWGLLRGKLFGLLAAGYLLSIMLFSQIPMVIGTLFGERLVFAASLFFCAGVAWALWGLSFRFQANVEERKPTLFAAVMLPFILIGSWLTIQRNPDWKDNLTLFSADVVKYPKSVRLQNFVATSQIRAASLDSTLTQVQRDSLLLAAEGHIKASLAIKPTPTALFDLANMRLNQKRYPEAIENYRQSLNLFELQGCRQNLAVALRSQAVVMGEAKQPDKARELLSEAIKIMPTDAESQFFMGISYAIQGQIAQALPYFEKALQLNPNEQRYQSAVQSARK
jgi:protein O-mannosyl-transferase